MAERTNIATQMRAGDDEDNRSAEAIRQDIAAKRETISETVDKLGERIQETLDWREYIAEYPVVAIGLAAGVGFLVSGIFKHHPSPQERIMDAVAELTEDITDRVSSVAGDTLGKKKMISGKTVKAALTATITKAALDFAKEKGRSLLAGDGAQNRNRRVGAEDIHSRTREDFDPIIRNENATSSSIGSY
jgi:ElaB/YqjD/DUF883 family membrane-anchored ribosome-binding protein